MYRAVAVARARLPVSARMRPKWTSNCARFLIQCRSRLDGERVILDGRDISDVIIEPEIGDLASRFSALPIVREKMRDLQRAAGAGGGVVMEGRDIGHRDFFPDAEVKFFLVADADVRAARRYGELAHKGVATTLAEVAAQLAERDRRDAGRTLAPLKTRRRRES